MQQRSTTTLSRVAAILFFGSLLGLILAVTLKGEVPGTMHHQFSERDTSSWNLCVENQTAANFTVTAAGINRALVNEVSLIGESERAYRFTRRPRARWIRALAIAGMAASFLMATPALDVGETWIRVGVPVLTGGIQIAQPAIEANQRRDFELGVYWGAVRTLAPGEAHCALVMTAKVDQPQSFQVEFAPPVNRALLVVPEGMGAIPYGMTWDELQRLRKPPVERLPVTPTVVAENGVGAYWK